MLLGLVFAVIALAGIMRHGREGLSIKGVTGLMFNGLIGMFLVSSLPSEQDEGLERLQHANNQLIEERLANTNLVTDPQRDLTLLGRVEPQMRASSEHLRAGVERCQRNAGIIDNLALPKPFFELGRLRLTRC